MRFKHVRALGYEVKHGGLVLNHALIAELYLDNPDIHEAVAGAEKAIRDALKTEDLRVRVECPLQIWSKLNFLASPD
jgi:hypothetical protein